MKSRKGQIPQHILPKQFNHPQADHPLLTILEQVVDPRKPSLTFAHSLPSILFIVLVCVLAGGNDWKEIVTIADGLKDWIGRYVDISQGIPCERTFKNIFNILNPSELNRVLMESARYLIRKVDQKLVISFDGQTLKGTADANSGCQAIHMLHAWSEAYGLCLGQYKVDDKTNEITMLPHFLQLFELKGTIITVDAMNTQRANADLIIEQKADYVFPVKENHAALYRQIEEAFSRMDKIEKKPEIASSLPVGWNPKPEDASKFETIEKSHGRIETRQCTTLPIGDLGLRHEWKGSRSISRIVRERTINGKTTNETHYFITSLVPDATLIASAVREHWGVENGLHWRLDVIFKQDDQRYRDKQGASNLSALRKTALNLLVQDKTIKAGVASKRLRFACDSVYREEIFKKFF